MWKTPKTKLKHVTGTSSPHFDAFLLFIQLTASRKALTSSGRNQTSPCSSTWPWARKKLQALEPPILTGIWQTEAFVISVLSYTDHLWLQSKKGYVLWIMFSSLSPTVQDWGFQCGEDHHEAAKGWGQAWPDRHHHPLRGPEVLPGAVHAVQWFPPHKTLPGTAV